MTHVFEPFLCTHLPVPTTGDLYFSNDEAEEAVEALLALWQPEVLELFCRMPKWCRPEELPSPESREDTPTFTVFCNGATPSTAVTEHSLTLLGSPAGSFNSRIRIALGLQESHSNNLDDSSIYYSSIGLGVLLIDALFEAQNHSNLMQHEQIWSCIQSALRARGEGDSALEMESLREAANHLVVAREALSSSNGHLVDFTELPSDETHIPESASHAAGMPRTIAASGADLIRLTNAKPDIIQILKNEIQSGQTELIGGCYLDRPESGLPMGSILWNLSRGQRVLADIFGKPARIHYRKHALSIPSLPEILRHFGLVHQVLPLERKAGTFPSSRASVVSWSWGDAMGLESFAGVPINTFSSKEILHLARRFSESISTDYTPVLFFRNGQFPPCRAYKAFCRLSYLAPVFGKFTDMESLFRSVSAGDYWNESSGCEFRDNLNQIDHARTSARNWLDAAMVFESLHRFIEAPSTTRSKISDAENQIESFIYQQDTKELALEAGKCLAERVLRTGEPGRSGFLLLNPNSFNRRVIVDLEGPDSLPTQSPVLACEPGTTGNAKAVVEIPGLGFAWIPRTGTKGTQVPRQRWQLADERGVRNEFLEAEFDPATGGVRGLRDLRHRIPRIQQTIQIGKGCSMMAKTTKVLSRGPARGELLVEGVFVDGQGQTVGNFKQTLRTWIGRPLVELEIEASKSPPSDETIPKLRLFWKDPAAEILIGSMGQSTRLTGEGSHSTEYIHLLDGSNATTVISQKPMTIKRLGNRSIELNMESRNDGWHSLSLGFAVDRDYPHLFAKGWQSPFLAIPVDKGPPSVGTSGWLFHVDSPSVSLERLGLSTDNEIEAIFVECLNEPATVGLNFAKSPAQAIQSEDRTETGRQLTFDNGCASFDIRRRGITTISLKPES